MTDRMTDRMTTKVLSSRPRIKCGETNYACHIHFQVVILYIYKQLRCSLFIISQCVIMFTVAVYSLLLQIVLSFHISIDGERGNDSRGCIQGQFSCQSLQYVAMMTNDTLRDNVTIVIIGSPSYFVGQCHVLWYQWTKPHW